MTKIFGSLTLAATFLFLVFSIIGPMSAHAQTSTTPFCYSFSQNLGLGRPLNASDAAALTQVLVSAGLWNANTPITTYNDNVASAVSGFQQRYAAQILTPNGLSYGTGYVGVSTRAQMNAMYACLTNTTNPPTTTFQCPLGWTCAPTVATPPVFICPAGWTCTIPTLPPITANPPVTTISTSTDNSTTSPVFVADWGGPFALPTAPMLNKQTGPTLNTAGDYYVTYTATFNLRVQANSNVVFGLATSSFPAVILDNSFVSIFKNSTDINGHSEPLGNFNPAPVIAYSAPTGATVSADGMFFTIPAGTTVTVPITVTFTLKNPGSDAYGVALRAVVWSDSIGGASQRSNLSATNQAHTLMTAVI